MSLTYVLLSNEPICIFLRWFNYKESSEINLFPLTSGNLFLSLPISCKGITSQIKLTNFGENEENRPQNSEIITESVSSYFCTKKFINRQRMS